jgi:predicted cobalt transporter CbtA
MDVNISSLASSSCDFAAAAAAAASRRGWSPEPGFERKIQTFRTESLNVVLLFELRHDKKTTEKEQNGNSVLFIGGSRG